MAFSSSPSPARDVADILLEMRNPNTRTRPGLLWEQAANLFVDLDEGEQRMVWVHCLDALARSPPIIPQGPEYYQVSQATWVDTCRRQLKWLNERLVWYQGLESKDAVSHLAVVTQSEPRTVMVVAEETPTPKPKSSPKPHPDARLLLRRLSKRRKKRIQRRWRPALLLLLHQNPSSHHQRLRRQNP